MRIMLSILAIIFFVLLFPPRVHAIIFLPAIILIPIAKLVAIIMAGFSLPAVTLGALWSKLFKKSLKRTLVVVTMILLVTGIALIVIFKLENPGRPMF